MLSNFVRKAKLTKDTLKRYRSYKKNVFNTLKRHSEEALAKSQETNLQRMTKDHLSELSEKLKKNAPRIGTVLAIGTTIPSFYFMYNLVWEKYDSQKFYTSIKQGVDWINYLNAFSAAVYFGLEAVRFSDRAAKTKWVAPRHTYLLVLIPFFLSLGSLSFCDTLHRHILLPTLGNEVALLLLESLLVNQNLIPYWFFDIKYRLHVFTLFIIASYHYSMKYLGEDVKNQPEKYKGDVLPLSLRP